MSWKHDDFEIEAIANSSKVKYGSRVLTSISSQTISFDSSFSSIPVLNGLTVDYCAEKKIKYIIRGLRDCSDFEYEKKLALMNEDLNQKITTIFIPCSKEFLGVSSSLIKSIIKNNGNYIKFIPKEIKDEKLI